jgi:hypothetical protein
MSVSVRVIYYIFALLLVANYSLFFDQPIMQIDRRGSLSNVRRRS